MAPSTRTTAPSKSAEHEGEENALEALLAHSRAAAAVYHSAFGAFCRSTTAKEFELAMDTLEAAQVAEQEARRADMGRMAAITARCEYFLEQNPEPDAWWVIVGLGVEMEDAQGHMWYLQYPLEDALADGTSHVTVATTRPETMFGDTAVAVHPDEVAACLLRGRIPIGTALPCSG